MKKWFEEKGLDVALRSTEGIANFSDLDTVISDDEDNVIYSYDEKDDDEISAKEKNAINGDGKDRLKSRDYALNMFRKELSIVRRLKIFFNMMPVLGFNSSSYDLPRLLNHICMMYLLTILRSKHRIYSS